MNASFCIYSKICLKQPLSKRPKIGFQDQLSLNAGQKEEHSAILSTSIKLSFVIKIFVLSNFEWPLKTGFTVFSFYYGKLSVGLIGITHNLPLIF